MSSSERRDGEALRAYRPLSGQTDRHKTGFFMKHKRELTTLALVRYTSGHKKGRLKILSIDPPAPPPRAANNSGLGLLHL